MKTAEWKVERREGFYFKNMEDTDSKKEFAVLILRLSDIPSYWQEQQIT